MTDTTTDPHGGPDDEQTGGPVVGYTEGAFDLFHIGHLDLLTAAAQRCDHLVVGVLSDDLCQAVTGVRPYISAAERRSVVEAVRGVDAVVPVADGNLGAMHASTGFSVVFRHGGPAAPADDTATADGTARADDTTPGDDTAHRSVAGYEIVDLPAPRQTTSSVLATALSAHLAPAAEL